MIYLDTAALVKLLRREPECDALVDWLDDRADTLLVTSTLSEVGLPRALRRIDPTLLAGAPALLERWRGMRSTSSCARPQPRT
jgi:uncharacterized protein